MRILGACVLASFPGRLGPGNEARCVHVLVASVYGYATLESLGSPHTEDCLDETGPPCDVNARCDELPGRNNFTCTCLPWFIGDGFMCRPGKLYAYIDNLPIPLNNSLQENPIWIWACDLLVVL